MAKLAINGGKPLRTKPFCSWPIVREETDLAAGVVRAGAWGHLFCQVESKVDEFRERFARYHGTDYAVPVTNGSVALGSWMCEVTYSNFAPARSSTFARSCVP